MIVENYNNCTQKYGKDITDKMVSMGIPPKFLLAACRFHIENKVLINDLVSYFKEWNSYVLKYNAVDVNTISYENFRHLISIERLKHCLPNPIVITDKGALGRLDTVKDARNIPVETKWCVKARGKFESVLKQGDELYAIYLPNEPKPFTFTIALIQKGNVTYYNSDNKRQFELDDPQKNAHQIFQSKLPQEIIDYLYDRAATQIENIK